MKKVLKKNKTLSHKKEIFSSQANETPNFKNLVTMIKKELASLLK